MKKAIIILTFVSAFLVCAQAQNIVEIKPDKKVVHVEQLGLNNGASVLDALAIMPDLLNRNSESIIDNFSVQIDGKDVGSSTDVVLVQTILAEVNVIEISTSPSVSDQQNGQGGVINIKMKEAQDGFHGDVILDASTEWDVMPSVLMSYRKNNWSLRGSLMMEYYHPSTVAYSERTSPTSFFTSMDTLTGNFTQETAKFSAIYKTEQDEVKIHVWESYAYTDRLSLNSMVQNQKYGAESVEGRNGAASGKRIIEQMVGTDTVSMFNHALNVVADMSYKHTFSNKGTIETSLHYDYSPRNNVDNTSYDPAYYRALSDVLNVKTNYRYQTSNQPHQLNAEIKTKHTIGRWSDNHSLDLEVGTNYQLALSRINESASTQREALPRPTETSVDYSNQSHYLSPFAKFSYFYKTLTMELGGRYQYQHQTIDGAAIPSHDWTGNININWAVAPHHNLRALASRNLIRPSVQQLSPIVYYNQGQKTYMTGNPNLHPMQVYNADLDYSFDFQNEKHNLLLDVGLSYLHSLNSITQVMRESKEDQLIYTTYENNVNEKNNVLNLNLLLCYKVGVYSLFFTGNTFYKMQHQGEAIKSRLSYNVAIANNFNFAKDWALSFKLVYNSETWAMDMITGDCFTANIRLAKRWGQWLVHADINDVFDYISTDYGKDGDVNLMRWYDPHQQCVAVGFAYQF